jgi:hypothetical protein
VCTPACPPPCCFFQLGGGGGVMSAFFGWASSHNKNNKKGDFFQLISTLFVKWREVLYTAEKLFLWSKFPSLGWRSADFLQGVLSQKNICRTCANRLVQPSSKISMLMCHKSRFFLFPDIEVEKINIPWMSKLKNSLFFIFFCFPFFLFVEKMKFWCN